MRRARILTSVVAAVAVAGILASGTPVATEPAGAYRDTQSPATSPQQPPAQQPPAPQQPPVFRAGTDRIAVDAGVLDRFGRPVDDVRVEEFRLKVDGKPRRVVSAEFVSFRDLPPMDAPKGYSSTAGRPPGRLLMLVIDQGNLRKGSIKSIVSAALRFIDQLGPNDRVALHLIPGAGPVVNFTSDHGLIKRTLEASAGQVVEADRTGRVGVAEAIEMLERPVPRGELPPAQSMLADVIERECPGDHDPVSIARCRSQLENLARTVYAEARARAIATIVSLREIIERLAGSSDPKTLVLVTEGMHVGQFADVSWIEDRTAAASLGFFALRVDQGRFDATMARRSPTRNADQDLLVDGLDLVTGLARGTVWPMAGDPGVTFERLRLELSGQYLLSFEPEAGDRDGRTHRIDVEVTRPGLRVAGRRAFALDSVNRVNAIDSQLAEVVRSPMLYSDFELRATTYSFRDPASGKVRILVSSDVDPGAGAAAEIGLAYAVTGADGQIVAADVERPIEGPAGSSPGRHFTGAFVVDPGAYVVKVVAIGGGGRRASIEHRFEAAVASYGQLRLGDLLLAAADSGGGQVKPAIDGRIRTATVVGYTEIYSDADVQLNEAELMFEVARDETGPALASTPMRMAVTGEARGRRTAEASLPLALVPDGNYVARAVVRVGGREAVHVTRPFRIEAASTRATEASAGGPATLVPFTSKPEVFDRAAVLTRAVIGFFLDRLAMPGLPAVPASLTPAVGLARSARLDQARTIALALPEAHFAAPFIAGLADLADGDLQNAAVRFGAALTAAPDFHPAAFYLGAAYAAAGRDADAVTAWQAAFVVERQAPWLHTVLADALLRSDQRPRAAAVIREAMTLWPGSDDVIVRQAILLALDGADREAMRLLSPYLSRHPDDLDRVLLGMKLIHDARTAGRSLESADGDRTRFLQYFDLYERANGPRLADARRWKQAVER